MSQPERSTPEWKSGHPLKEGVYETRVLNLPDQIYYARWWRQQWLSDRATPDEAAQQIHPSMMTEREWRGEPMQVKAVPSETTVIPRDAGSAYDAGLEAAAKEVESHWNHSETEVNQQAQASRSAAVVRRLKRNAAPHTPETEPAASHPGRSSAVAARDEQFDKQETPRSEHHRNEVRKHFEWLVNKYATEDFRNTNTEAGCIWNDAVNLANGIKEVLSARVETMDTAPKDGTPILGFVPSYYEGKGAWVVVLWLGKKGMRDAGWMDNRAWKVEPQCWMPLPAIPSYVKS